MYAVPYTLGFISRVGLVIVCCAAPLMTADRLSELEVILLRLETSAMNGQLQSNISFFIAKADVTFPPPIASVDLVPVVRPVVLLRAGVFGFEDTHVFFNDTDGVAIVAVERLGAAFGVAVVQFTTEDGTAHAESGGYTTVQGLLQFQPYVTRQVCNMKSYYVHSSDCVYLMFHF